MYLQPLLKEELGGGYLVGDTHAAVCAVINPPLDRIENILELVATRGMRIISVIESHLPADTFCGCRALARRTGATIYVHERAPVDYPHQKLPDGIFRFFRASEALTRSTSHQEAPHLPPEDGKNIACWYLEEVIHRGNVAAVDESIATNFLLTWPGSPASVRGPEAFRQLLILYGRAFPDLQWTTEEVSAEAETVVVQLRARGTHQRELMGIPPTGKHMTWTETHIFRVADGKLVEHWTHLDPLSKLQHLGVLPRTE